MAALRLLLADDHILILEGLVKLLSSTYEIVDTVYDGRALVESFRKFKPDVVVTDITMPLMNGLGAIRQLRKEGSHPKVVFLTMHDDLDLIRECIENGESAFVTKSRAYQDLPIAIEAVLNNHKCVLRALSAGTSEEQDGPLGENIRMDPLTARQREILQGFAEGKSMKEIATQMNLSTRTVEWHKYRMMRTLHVRNNAELVRHAVKTKLVL
jgi:DNA-binding NarL/FixJ family response regulator